MKKILLVKYGELFLRGENKSIYEKMLVDKIRRSLQLSGTKVYLEQARIIIENENGDLEYDSVIPKVMTVLGISSICKCSKLDKFDISSLTESAKLHLEEAFEDKTVSFKVVTKRVDKRYPLKSMDISAKVGEFILNSFPKSKVEVNKPDTIVYIEIRKYAYIYNDIIKGLGGLPAGSSGNSTLLLSGGIDSPVAGFMAAKRGSSLTAVYFHSPPYVSERAKYKVIDLAKKLSVYVDDLKLYVVPFTDIQLYIQERVVPERVTILLKRQMLKIARIIAEKEKCSCIITGDSIGQVASQTLQSIQAIDSAADMAVLRPLCGLDKQEIIDLAKKIETFEISIQPYDDCCTLFVAAHPETKPKRSVIENIERKMTELPLMNEEAAGNSEIIEVNVYEN